ncbi:Asp-tRNA(Asn)/Glu-tRNA(Gln) amidotransferase subunit GatC [Litoribacillus peritrichatus]|uniref:Aspartyl/glutamyl-tRNA(Asn/Gln) amidotransferase subunit C n=1 Tax=Litoribacillus peritrichatus TaxID=718191 RepID=A0ABP7N7J3_9GAMM
MSIDHDQVAKIAELARLKIEPSQLDQYAENLSSILDLADQLQAVDTDGIEPLANPLDAAQRLRADKVTETNQREHLQKNAPSAEAGLFLVPKVIE